MQPNMEGNIISFSSLFCTFSHGISHLSLIQGSNPRLECRPDNF